MRLQAAFLLLASIVPSALAIFADDAYHIDYHHALLGSPQARTTFFHKPSSSSSASLLYTLSEKLVLGAVNPKDGTIVWRQVLADSTKTKEGAAAFFLRAVDGEDAVVSAIDNVVSSWGALDGKLSWENKFGDGPVTDLEILQLEEGSAAQAAKDSIVLFGGQNGLVRRLDGGSGNVKWEYKDESDDTPFQVSTSATNVFYISLQSASRKGYKIKVTALDPQTGRVTHQHTLSSEAEVSSPSSIVFVGANLASPLIAWVDDARTLLKLNVIGSKQVNSVNIENTSGEDIRKVEIHAPHALNSLPHFLVHYKTESKSWAEVYHTDLKSSTISNAYRLPVFQESSAFATSNIDANVYFTRITKSEISVVSSASHGILARWTPKNPSKDAAQHAVSEVVARGGTTYAVRFAQVLESGDWTLVRNGKTEWTRPESLTDAVAAAWAEVDGEEELAHELEVEGHASLLGAYIHRLKRHAKDLEYLPSWLQQLPLRILSSVVSKEVTDLTDFGLKKYIIVATETGRLLALDSAQQGSIVWSVKATDVEGTKWNVKAINALQGVATVYVDDGSFVKVNVASGAVIEKGAPTQQRSSIALVPSEGSPTAVDIRSDGVPDFSSINLGNNAFIVSTSDDGRVLGWNSIAPKTPVWEFVPPKGERLLSATTRPSYDPVASIGKVLGDRSVLYKYLNPNLALITTVGDNTASFYLLDAISGQILHTVTHKGVDTRQPIASVMSENWFAYSLWGEAADESAAKGYRLVISELFESPIANDRGSLGDAANYTVQDKTGIPQPHVISQAFIIPEPISNMAVTKTRQGITVKQLLCTLPASSAIIGIPRPVLDPRRPVGRDPTRNEAEEGLAKYHPFLDFDPRWYLTHAREVLGIQHIRSTQTLLESTSLVFAYGLDVFGTRVMPSQAFDLLGKGFSKMQLLLTVVALGVGVAVLSPLARAKQVNMKWKI
ncbi:hypothetical protein AJ80_03824 [Polytolypa hystricis UAMH7299]|uniref:ER membrane protein complex subunit 1 n=1 Tax=Polytolypa hystricis (strain UAMH7299) TaxID=1447883 RepID=A0A2B7YF20_POLH7|nr:hypothetical protein AJ80_03824 [Polytolypa hystricis UAMH7299]